MRMGILFHHNLGKSVSLVLHLILPLSRNEGTIRKHACIEACYLLLHERFPCPFWYEFENPCSSIDPYGNTVLFTRDILC